MSELIADYLALPDVQLFVKHWRAYVVLFAAMAGLVLWNGKHRWKR